MESKLGDRLQAFIDYKKMSNVDFAKSIGTSKQKIDYWKNTNAMTGDWIMKLIDKYVELNPRWLLLGTGNMLEEIPTTNENTANEPGTGYSGSDENLQRRIKLLEALLYDELGKKQKGE